MNKKLKTSMEKREEKFWTMTRSGQADGQHYMCMGPEEPIPTPPPDEPESPV